MENDQNLQEHPNQPILEAILTNQDKNSKNQENLLEHILVETNKNNPEPLLEAVIVETSKTNKAIKELSDKLEPQEIGDGALFTVKGVKGDKGDKGDRGDDPTAEELLNIINPLLPTDKDLLLLIKPLIPAPIKGEKGDSPTATELRALIRPLIPAPIKGEDGKTPSTEELINLIKPLIPAPIKGKDGKSISKELLATIQKYIKQSENNLLWVNNGAVKLLHAGTGISIDNTDPQNPIISSTGGGGGTWGSIIGTLSNQLDLQAALDLKANIADLGAVAFSNDYNDLDNLPTIPTGTIDGTLTSNELVYSVDSNTVGSLSVATYPSLTELSYVKGVTSGIQSQIDSKQPQLNGTGFVKISGTTISYDNSTYLTTAAAAAAYQPLDSDLTTIAGLTATTDNFIVSVASAWASRTPSQVRTTLGLVIGTNVQAWDADLDTWATKTAPSGVVVGTTDAQSLTNKSVNGVTLVSGGTATKYLSEDGTYTTPAGGGSGNLEVGVTVIDSGTTTKVLYNNAGVLGEYTISGSGNVAMTTSPVFTTPNIGNATGNVSGNAGTATALQNARTIGGVSFDGTGNIVPQTIQTTDESTDTTCFPLFITASGAQSLQPHTNTSFTFNSNTGALGATTFVGSGTSLTGIPYTITGTANQVIASAGTGNITLSLPQSIATSSTPQFAKLGLGAAADANRIFYVTGNVAGGVATIERTNAATNAAVGTVIIKGTSTGDMVDGFGSAFQFSIQDTAAVENIIANIIGYRDGADNSGALALSTALGGSSTAIQQIYSRGGVDFLINAQSASITSGLLPQFYVKGGNGTGLTASTERASYYFDPTGTIQFATGALTNQRAFILLAPTYSFVGSSTITNGATFYIDQAPINGTNATITNKYAIWVDAGDTRLDGNLLLPTSGSVINFNSGDVTITHASNVLAFAGASSGYTFDTGGVVIGHTAKLSIGGQSAINEQFGTDATTGSMSLGMFNATAGTQAEFQFYRSKNAAIGSSTVVASGDGLGKITWYGAQQTGTFATQTAAAQIRAEVDGTVTSGGSGDMPGRIVFATTADAGSSVTDRLILDSAGILKPNANDGVALGTATLSYADLFLASGAVINFNNGNVTLTHSAGTLTLGGTSTLALGTNSITMTGSLAATGARVTKGWFTNIESTNMITIGGTSLTTVAQTFQNKTITNSNNVLGGVTMTLGSDADGDTYYRASNVLTRLAKGTAGQVLTMNAGATAPQWSTPSSSEFPIQDVPISTTAFGAATGQLFMCTQVTSNTAIYYAYQPSSGSQVELYRFQKQASGQYVRTHTTTLSTSSNGLRGIVATSGFVYVFALIGGVRSCRRYSLTDLTGVTTMTFTGTTNDVCWTDGTDIYIQAASGTFDKYTISGTTMTNAANVSFTSSSFSGTVYCDGTNVWMTDGAAGTFNLRKYPKAGGSATSTTSIYFQPTAYYNLNGSGSNFNFFYGGSGQLGLGWGYDMSTPTTQSGSFLHLTAIDLP